MLLDKNFVHSDSSLNVYGFRLLTSGYQIQEYAKNPIGFYMHNRDLGVLVRWENLRIEGDKVIGQPDINMSNARGAQTCDEILKGFLNAASVGGIVILESSDDPALKLNGQTGPTITKWFNRETSLCDVPGNFGALVLYDHNDNIINLSSFLGTNNKGLVDTANNAPRLTYLKSLNFDDLDKKGLAQELINLDYGAWRNKFIAKFGIAPKGWDEKLLSSSTSTVTASLSAVETLRIEYLKSLSFDELDKTGLAEELVKLDYNAWRNKYIARWGYPPQYMDKKYLPQ